MTLRSIGRAAVPLTTTLGLNAVPAYGALVGGWSPATVMLIYFVENLLLIGGTSARLLWLLPAREDLPGAARPLQRATMTRDYLVVALGFSAGAGIFLLMMIFLFLKLPVEPEAIWASLRTLALIEAAGLVIDRVWGGRRALADGNIWINQSLGRVFLLFLGVFIGVFVAALSGPWFVAPFIGLKLITDLGSHVQAIQRMWRRGVG